LPPGQEPALLTRCFSSKVLVADPTNSVVGENRCSVFGTGPIILIPDRNVRYAVVP
jgi:hypothetical protein